MITLNGIIYSLDEAVEWLNRLFAGCCELNHGLVSCEFDGYDIHTVKEINKRSITIYLGNGGYDSCTIKLFESKEYNIDLIASGTIEIKAI